LVKLIIHDFISNTLDLLVVVSKPKIVRKHYCYITALVGECGQTKVTKAKGTNKVPWQWDEVHQRAFDHIQATITRDVVLAYPDYYEVFEIYTDAPSKQLGAVITQKNRPIAFFSRKLSVAQRKYSVTKI
jgi:hypothetical protein